MIYRVLTTVQVEGNKDYADRFEKLVEEAPPLTAKKALELCNGKIPIVGNVIKGCLDYNSLIALERLHAPATETKSQFYVTQLNNIWGLSIGSKSAGLEIIQERHPSGPKEFLKDEENLFFYVETPEEFLRETHSLLPSTHMRRKFRCLIE
jgi:hypothetical protein